jgi:hypothetical protein
MPSLIRRRQEGGRCPPCVSRHTCWGWEEPAAWRYRQPPGACAGLPQTNTACPCCCMPVCVLSCIFLSACPPRASPAPGAGVVGWMDGFYVGVVGLMDGLYVRGCGWVDGWVGLYVGGRSRHNAVSEVCHQHLYPAWPATRLLFFLASRRSCVMHCPPASSWGSTQAHPRARSPPPPSAPSSPATATPHEPHTPAPAPRQRAGLRPIYDCAIYICPSTAACARSTRPYPTCLPRRGTPTHPSIHPLLFPHRPACPKRRAPLAPPSLLDDAALLGQPRPSCASCPATAAD